MPHEKKRKRWTTPDIPRQASRRVIIITGANSGIAWETALELARAGARITLTARTAAKGEETAGRIRRIVPSLQLRPSILDLASLQSVQKFAAREGGQRLDLLINNTAAMATKRREFTIDGFETTLGTNCFCSFVFIGLLLLALPRGDKPRVVIVANAAGKQGRICFNDLQADRHYSLMVAYVRYKLADLVFALELQRQIDATHAVCQNIVSSWLCHQQPAE